MTGAACQVCEENCVNRPKNNAEASIKCDNCVNWAHWKCVGQKNPQKIVKPKTYKCSDCRARFLEVKSEVMSGSRKDPSDKKMSVTVSNDKLDQIMEKLSKLETIEKDCKEIRISLDNRVTEVEKDVRNLEGSLQYVANQVEDSQQYQRVNNLIISGIPEQIDPYKAVIDLANLLNVKITKENIDIAHRLPSRKSPKPILVKFIQRWAKQDISEARYKKKELTTKDLKYDGPNSKIFLSEHLIPALQELHYVARKMVKDEKIYKVHIRNGKIIIIPEKDGEKVQIRTLSDLAHYN